MIIRHTTLFSDVKHVPWKSLQMISYDDDDISRCKVYKVSEVVSLVELKYCLMFWLSLWHPLTFLTYTLFSE